MTTHVRRVSVFVLLLFAALFVNLNVLQVLRAGELANHPQNRRLLIQEYSIERGPILVGDEQIAFSEETGGTLNYRRRYQPGGRFAHLMGYYSILYGRAGLEQALNEELTGTRPELLAENLASLLGQRDPVGNTIRLTIDPAAQAAAAEGLGGRPGAAVAIDPASGAILALYSNPTYDPNPLSSHDGDEARAAWNALQEDPQEPLANRATARRYAPGSAFKVIVAAAALERGLTPETRFEDPTSYTPPQTDRSIGNFGGGTCAGGGSITLAEAMEVSCNTVFARLGADLGGDALAEQAERFGFNREIPFELQVAESVANSDLDPPAAAQSAIGGRDVQATALQMAMVAGAVANDGVLMRPHVVAEVLDPSGRQVRGAESGPWVDGAFTAQAVSEENAAALRDMMVRVVSSGTATRAQVPGATVGGKTGTADPGTGAPSNVWFIGFASTDEGPQVAVAVAIPEAGEGATGGREAAPIGGAIMEAALD